MNEFEFKSDAAPTHCSQTGSERRTDYGRIVDGVPGCILVADAEGQIVYANRVAVATLGRPLPRDTSSPRHSPRFSSASCYIHCLFLRCVSGQTLHSHLLPK